MSCRRPNVCHSRRGETRHGLLPSHSEAFGYIRIAAVLRANSGVSAESTTYERALTLLGFRARSVAELRGKLIERGAPKAEVEEVLARLASQKLLDDADFARQFARARITGPGASRIRILQELRRKGVASEVAERALEQLGEEEGIDATASVHRVAEKKWKALAKLDELTRRRRLYAFLARRGFNPDEIRSAMNKVGAQADA